MGCSSSNLVSSLEVSAPKNLLEDDSFTGSFVIVCEKKGITLDRDIRATLKLRATMVTLTGRKNKYTNKPETTEQAHIVWDVGGPIAKRGQKLQVGENRLDFDFNLENKLQELDKYIQPKDLVKKFGSCTFIKYDYILRAGSLQVKEFVRYPNLFPPDENGVRVISEGFSADNAASIIGDAASLMDSIATIVECVGA